MVSTTAYDRGRLRLPEILIFGVILALLGIGTYTRNGLWTDEVGLWKDCLAKSPRKARVQSNLGGAYLGAGVYDKALEYLTRSLELDPKVMVVHFNLGVAYQKTGDVKKAVAHFHRALELDPEFVVIRFILGGLYIDNGQYEEAVGEFKALVSAYPYYPEAHNRLGVAYGAMKKFDLAAKAFEGELRTNPNNGLAHLNLGQLNWYEFGNREKAIRHLRMALLLNPYLPGRTQVQRLLRQIERPPG
jgi:protein O-mannosyl-transferase